MDRPISRLFKLICLALLLNTAALWAQDDLVRVSIQPDNEEWDWQPYAEKLAGRLATAIDSRVNEGFPRREFTLDSLTTTLEFRLRIDTQGRLSHFAPLSPRHRYLAYLIQRTTRELGSFDPLPEDFPLFYFDGTIRFNCRMKPTGMYKRLYFEEPLDTLEETAVTPFYKTVKSSTPLILYEPQKPDKKTLLEDFKKRIGVVEEISDTSSYTPLDFTKRVVAVDVAYDSLTGNVFESEMLKTRIEAAMLEAGAVLTELELAPKPPPPPAPETAEATEDSSLSEQLPDTSAIDTLESAAEQKPAVQLPERDFVEAFASRLSQKTVLVFSAGVAADTVPNKGVCRVRLFPSDKPGDIKRRVDYTFAHSGILPDSLGRLIVTRLTAPPRKPRPPAKPKPKTKPKAAPAVKAESDSAAVDTTAAVKAAGADSTAPVTVDTTAAAKAAEPDSAAAPSDTAKIPVTSPAPAKADTAAAAPDTSAKQPQAAPEAPPPADTSSASVDTNGQSAPTTPEPPAEVLPDTAEAAPDSTVKTPGESP